MNTRGDATDRSGPLRKETGGIYYSFYRPFEAAFAGEVGGVAFVAFSATGIICAFTQAKSMSAAPLLTCFYVCETFCLCWEGKGINIFSGEDQKYETFFREKQKREEEA